MSTPRVSVVMSVWNGELFLREAVESILEQTFRDFEFIVIDDGSSDRSASILESYRISDSRVRVYHQQNSGLVESLNRGCRLASGKYIARMDADDVAISNRLLWQVEFMESNPHVGVLGGAVQFINADGRCLNTCILPVGNKEIKSALLSNCVIVHPTVLIRKDVFLSVGGYRRCVVDAEDYDLWLRIAESWQVANLEKTVLRRRHHANQLSVSNRNQQVFSVLAAQAAASSRRNGLGDPLDSIAKITPQTLVSLGVSEATKTAALGKNILGRIKSMEKAGEYLAASLMYSEIQHSDNWIKADRWVIADLKLVQARQYWRERRRWMSVLTAGSAVAGRPRLLGRPVKRFISMLFRWGKSLWSTRY